MADITAPSTELNWQQGEGGWWMLNDRNVFRVDPASGFVCVSAHLPWQVDIDMAWIAAQVKAQDNPDIPKATLAQSYAVLFGLLLAAGIIGAMVAWLVMR